MNLLPVRYISIRERLIALFNVLNNRHFSIWIAPKSMMSMEEIRNREEYSAADTIQDKHYFDEPQLRSMKVSQILSYLDNFTSNQEIGFKNPNSTVVEIYESIQEYLSLWCELMLHAPEHQSPPMKELRQLEKLAYIIFPMYKAIKPFVTNKVIRDIGKDDQSLNKQGLMGLGALFTMNNASTLKNRDFSWVSHLDEYEGRQVGGNFTDIATLSALYFPPANVSSEPTMIKEADSIGTVEQTGDLANWLFKED